jgi:hypothetical protein
MNDMRDCDTGTCSGATKKKELLQQFSHLGLTLYGVVFEEHSNPGDEITNRVRADASQLEEFINSTLSDINRRH